MKRIFEVSGSLTPQDSNSVRVFRFELLETAGALKIFFDYSPLFCEDREINRRLVERAVLDYVAEEADGTFDSFMKNPRIENFIGSIRNLLNLIVYDGEGNFRGRWDYSRMAKNGGLIGEVSTPGFMNIPLCQGEWYMELEIFGIFTERCDFRIEVYHDSFTSDTDHILRKLSSSSQFTILDRPEIKKDNLYKGELHAHSNHSDGLLSLTEMKEKALSYGLDFLAVTDHNTVSHIHSPEVSMDGYLLKGYELTGFYGHFIVYGLDDFIPWHRGNEIIDTNLIADMVHERGGLFSLVHPFAIDRPICVGCPFRIEGFDYGKLDLMEVWSGEWRMRFPEIKRAIKLWERLLAQGLKITGVAGSDWHGSGEEDRYSGRFPMTFVISTDSSPSSIFEALREGRVYISTGCEIDFRISTKDKSGLMGDTIYAVKGERVKIEINLKNFEPDSTVRILKNAMVIKEARCGDSGRLSFDEVLDSTGLFRVEVWSRDSSSLLLITNHLKVVTNVRAG